MHDFREDGDAVVNEVTLDSNSGTMTIFPDAPEVKEIAQLLLELADSPRQVATTLDPGIGFVVPWWLYEKFVEVWAVRNDSRAVIVETIPAGSVIPEKAEVKASDINLDRFAAELRTELAADGKDTTELDRYIVARLETEMVLAESVPEATETPARRKPGRPRKES